MVGLFHFKCKNRHLHSDIINPGVSRISAVFCSWTYFVSCIEDEKYFRVTIEGKAAQSD